MITEKITTLIVDDESESRSLLRNFLYKYCAEVEVVAEAASVTEAVALIERTAPLLVFLDVNMPGTNGFTLFDHITVPDFQTVFVTAYDEFALEAFRHYALDYILKPIEISRLVATVERVRQEQSRNVNGALLRSLLQATQKSLVSGRVALPVLDGLEYVPVSEIVRCEAAGSYTHIYFVNRNKMIVSRPLTFYETLLQEQGFVRIHHKYLVNLKHVERYQRGKGGYVIMSDHSELEVSQRKRDDFLRLLKANM